MNINIIGAGRLGQQLAYTLRHNGRIQQITVCNRTEASAQRAMHATGAGAAVAQLQDLPNADITFITVPDDALPAVVDYLAHITIIKPGQIVLHCSGVLSSKELGALKQQGCLTASVHPLKAFRAHHLQDNAFQQCDCLIEGNATAVAILTDLFTHLGANVLSLSSDKKGAYHAAAVMASNYLVTLASCAIELFSDAGLSKAQAQGITQRLMHSSLTHIKAVADVADALTGPLARGDIKTIKTHLTNIQSPIINNLYRYAGLATLPLTGLNKDTTDTLDRLLSPTGADNK